MSKLAPAAPKGRSETRAAPPMLADEMRFRAQDAMHTIARAEQHKRDPELMRHVKALASDVHNAIGGSEMGKKKPGAKPKNPSNEASGRAAKRGVKQAMKGDSRKSSKLAPMGAAKKRGR